MGSLLLAYVFLGFSGGSCSILGRVVDDRGRPVRNAVVNAIRDTSGVFGAVTNERGGYCISSLPPGQYSVRAVGGTKPPSAHPSCESCCLAATDLATTRYPRQLLVRPRRPVRVDVRLRRSPVYCVRGEVRDSTGAPLKRASIGLKFGDTGNTAGVISEAGRFLLTNLPPGAYTLFLKDRPEQQLFHIRDRNIDDLVITVPDPFPGSPATPE